MQALENGLKALLNTRKPRPIGRETLDELVLQTLADTNTQVSAEFRKNQWEFLLRNELFRLAATEGKALKNAHTQYYDDLSFRLDLVLTFTEHDACEPIFPYNILQDVIEMQTIPSCAHIFSWIEDRADRLTGNMVPQKGKALILLRTLNDLARRLSKTGPTAAFCGRILTFLSRIFPLGERSGVNLRGDYGPEWDGPGSKGKEHTDKDEGKMDVDEKKEATQEDKMEVDGTKPTGDAAKSKREEKEDFYYTFWSLQVPLSRPPLFAEPAVYPAFKDAVNKVFPVIKEIGSKERAAKERTNKALLGDGPASLKRRRPSPEMEDITSKDDLFARYLTNPELLELEINETRFRRQFLLQLLIILHFLLTFTRSGQNELARNRSLYIDFTLEPSEAQWVQETINKVMEELTLIAPNGRAFAHTVATILEREKNWVGWKTQLCSPFDKESWREEIEDENSVKRKVGMEEATREVRKRMRVDPPEWEHKLGSGPLTEIWELGYRDLNDLKHPFQPGDVKDFVKKVKQDDARIEMRRKQLIRTAERLAQARAKAAAPPKESVPTPPVASAASLQESVSSPAPPRAAAASPPVHNPLHPSLPAKPGTTPVPHSSTQDSLSTLSSPPKRVSTPAPASSPAPAPAPAPPTPAPAAEPAPIVLPHDDQIQKLEESKQRWSWLALRTARDHYLQHFGKIGTGDIALLAQEIEKEKKERERAAANDEPAPAQTLVAGSGDERGVSPMVPAASAGAPASEDTAKGQEVGKAAVHPEGQNGNGAHKDSETDVKMEER